MNNIGVILLAAFVVAAISYLIGSLNMAIIISKIHKSKDIREYGSGNAGMTNMLRTFGKKAATWTFIGDFIKGAVVVFIARAIIKDLGIEFDMGYIAALFVILGHVYPIYFRFRGGKGIATALGAMFVLNWIAFITIAAGIIPMVFIIRIVSAVCICGASLYPVLNFVVLSLKDYDFITEVIPYSIISLIMSGIILYAHRENIARLRSGKEHYFGDGKK